MSKERFNKKLGDNIRKLREEKSISKLALSKKIKKERISIIRLEQGKLNPSYYFLLEVAKGMDVSVAELIRGLK